MAGGIGVVGGPITRHNWRSTLLVAVVFGIGLPNYSIFWGWGGGGLGWGGGENTLYLYCMICLSMTDCDIDSCS